MEKSGGTFESGSLEHFTNYKYAPSRPLAPSAMSLFALSNGQISSDMSRAIASNSVPVAIAGINGHQMITVGGVQPLQQSNILYSRGNVSLNGNSAESEVTSMTSLSNHSSNHTARSTPPEQLPQPEE